MSEATPLLAVRNVDKTFPVRRSAFGRPVEVVRAVNDVSFDIAPGSTLGIVGESGSGKSTLGRVCLRMIEADNGEIRFSGQNLRELPAGPLRAARAHMTTIFQDPYSALDPRWTVGRILDEPLRINGLSTRADRQRMIADILPRVGLSTDAVHRVPRSFSGGQRQRIVIARALVTRPKLVFCDEPVSSLDVSSRAQVLGLLRELQSEFHLAYLFVSHDLGVVERMSDRIAVMYLGSIVEIGDAETVAQRYRHPYTAALVSASPAPDPVAQRARNRIVLNGDPPSPIDVPTGCPFHPRCALAIARCATDKPELVVQPSGHGVACHVTNADRSLAGPSLFDSMVEQRRSLARTAGDTSAPDGPRPTTERTAS